MVTLSLAAWRGLNIEEAAFPMSDSIIAHAAAHASNSYVLPLTIREIGLAGIAILPDRMRSLRPEVVDSLAESIKAVGQLQPIVLRPQEGVGFYLVAGKHRYFAVKKLGWLSIRATIVEGMDADAALLSEIAENLHRADLTALERSEHLNRWRELTLEANAQVGHSGGKPDRGHSRTAKEFGTTRQAVERAEIIDSITPEIKETARAAGLADNQSALLAVAKQPTPEAQTQVIQKIAEHGSVAAAERQGDADADDDDGDPDETEADAAHREFQTGLTDALSALPPVYLDAIIRHRFDNFELREKLNKTGYNNRAQWARDVQECLLPRPGVSRKDYNFVSRLGWNCLGWSFPCDPSAEQLTRLAKILKGVRKARADGPTPTVAPSQESQNEILMSDAEPEPDETDLDFNHQSPAAIERRNADRIAAQGGFEADDAPAKLFRHNRKIAYIWPSKSPGYSQFSVIDADSGDVVEAKRGVRDDRLSEGLLLAGFDLHAAGDATLLSRDEWEADASGLGIKTGAAPGDGA
jgi:ParB-like chromosome segregation protein Spo0J